MTDNLNDKIEKLTLDTHILVWYAEGTNLSEEQVNLIEQARETGNLYISAISIWEITMLVSKDKIALSISLDEWINKLISTPGFNLIDISIPVLMQSCQLPQYEHKDPADRIIIASVRSIDSHLMSHDQKIIDYGDQGYIKVTM